jgi:peptidoglycan/LPS O-acetylase OafA/YrhL
MKRIKQLDALRTLAIFMVLSFHFGHMTNSPVIFRQIGWSGVDLFFILSGFLISGLLFREYKFSGHIRVGHFLAKRSMKLYPAYYVLVLGSIAIAMYFGSPYKWNAIWPSIVFVQNYVLSDGIWYHLWSMAVEEHFYILLPVAFWLATKHSKNPFGKLPHVTGGVIVFCLIGRCVLPLHLGYSHLRFDGLAFGVLIAYLWEFRPEVINQVIRSRGRWLLGATLLLLSPQFVLPITNPFMYTVGLTATFLVTAGS